MNKLIACLLIACSNVSLATSDPFYDYQNGELLIAREPLKNLAKQNNPSALYYLGLMNINGYAKSGNIRQGLAYIRSSASRGYLPAQLFMGKYALTVDNKPEDAIKWYKKAAEQNHLDSQMYVASAYLAGFGVKRNTDRARRYVIKAAKNGNAMAQYTLAKHFLERRNRRDRRMGMIWLKKSAKKDNLQAQYELGRRYYYGKSIHKDRQMAVHWLNKSAQQGHIKAHILLGKHHLSLGGGVDYAKAMDNFDKAAQDNDDEAQYHIAQLYLSSDSPFNDNKMAINWLMKSAKNGNLKAQKKLVSLYENENPVIAKDEKQAAYWESFSASKNKAPSNARQSMQQWIVANDGNQNFPQKYTLLGTRLNWSSHKTASQMGYHLNPKKTQIKKSDIFKYTMSITVPSHIHISSFIEVIGKSRYREKPISYYFPSHEIEGKDLIINDKSIRDIVKAAQSGFPRAQFKLAQLFEQGYGIEQDHEKSIYWYHKAAEQHYVRAEYQIGLSYLLGNGVEKNYHQAFHWLNKAAFKGNTLAQVTLANAYEHGLSHDTKNHSITKDMDRAISYYNIAAYNGSANAQLNLADIYSADDASNRHLSEKKKHHQLIKYLYENAAAQGLDGANLGLAYYYAVDGSNEEKKQWAYGVAKDAYDKGNKHAELLLAIMFDRGLGTVKNKAEAIALYQQASDRGDPIADFILGTYYYLGDGVDKSAERSIQLLENAATKNIAIADYNLSVVKYHNQQDFLPYLIKASDRHYTKASLALADYLLLHSDDAQGLQIAAKIYQRLSSLGYPSAQLKLAYMYEKGIVFNSNLKQAKHWYVQAAKQNNVIAQYLLANLYQAGSFNRRNKVELDQALHWYRAAAKGNYVPAFVSLGYLYETLLHDYPQARQWYEKAARAGNPQGQYDLALMYQYGKGGPVNLKQANTWFTKAAKNGIGNAQFAVANYYMHPDNGKTNPKVALKWYQKAANNNHPSAQYQLGLLHESQIAPRSDINDAVKMYQKASDQGHSGAKLALARLYHTGIGVQQDKNQASLLYRQAAMKGSPHAQYTLAHMYIKGDGIEQNTKAGARLLKQSARNGYLPAKQALNILNLQHKRNSYIHPSDFLMANKGRALNVNSMYLLALEALSEGNVQASRAWLKQLIDTYPRFDYAKTLYRHLDEMRASELYTALNP